nr:Glyco_hydro_43 [uncultured Clostridium sp.]
MKDIVCISTDDMKNWTDHGTVFDIKNCKWGATLSWAPSVAFRNGTFYLYYGDGDKSIGVATSSNVIGPYVDNNAGPVVSKDTPGVLEYDENHNLIKPSKDMPGALSGSQNWGFLVL